MPELPEVERVRLSLAERIVGQTVNRVEIRRADVVRTGDENQQRKKASPSQLLNSQTITAIHRHGKQLAIVGHAPSQPSFCVHLGMSGSLIHRPAEQPTDAPHSHVVWHLSGGGRLVFRDPRRFGGVWTFASLDDLQATRWVRLGADALTIQPRALHNQLTGTSRGLKAALLDQSLIAGLGNIYVDELLFQCRLHPACPANHLVLGTTQSLVRKMRKLLHRAIKSGGSSLRDYVDGEGRPGGFQFNHLVYGKADEPCSACSTLLVGIQVAGRTTVFCPECQVPSD